jgi:HK97 family phage prohead protease
MERKTTQAYSTKVLDEDQGIVETIFAVMGNVDDGNDVLHPGAFTKTFSERGRKVRVLDAHQTDSIMRVLGKPLELREMASGELPPDLKERHPEANGAAWAKVQFLMSTPEGKGAFERIKSGALDEWSFGYDALDKDYGESTKDGQKVTVRNLRSVKLYELSPVLWGMNPATATLSAKASEPEPAPEPEPEADKVRKAEQDGEHPASHYLVVEDPEAPSTWHLRVRNAAGEVDHRLMGAAWAALHGGYRGNRYEGPGKDEALRKLRALYEREGLDAPKAMDDEEIAAIANKVVELLREQQPAPVEEQAAVTEDQSDGAGPPEAPTLMAQVEALERDLRLMEG